MKNSTLFAAALFGGILGLMVPFTDKSPEQPITIVEAPISSAKTVLQ